MGKEKQTKKVNEAQNTKQEKKKLGLTTKIFIGLLLGALTGVILHYIVPSGFVKDTVIINGICYVVGNGFLRAMQMLVVPLVFCSLVCGAMAIGDSKKLGKVGVKTILFYLVTTAIAITIALGTAKIINPGIGLDMSALEIAETTIAEKQSFADVL
ncbi:MAG: cation:dicarboxylase symporter family transporter, partial [Niameybacter sp.]